MHKPTKKLAVVDRTRHVRLFKNGRSQAVRIPKDPELPGDEALIYRDGTRLVIEPLARPSLARRLKAVGETKVFTSVVVACELRFGAKKRGSATLATRVEDLLASIEVASLEPGVDCHYVEIRDVLERQGLPIGANDLLIAAHALQQDATLVTDNIAEFRRVPGLRVENWRRDS